MNSHYNGIIGGKTMNGDDFTGFPTFSYGPGGQVTGVDIYGGGTVAIADVPGFGGPMEAGSPDPVVQPPPPVMPPPIPVQQMQPPLIAQTQPAVTKVGYNGVTEFNGAYAGQEEAAIPTAIPLIGAGLAAVGLVLPRLAGKFSLGFLKSLWMRFGPKILKAAIGVLAFNEMMDLIGIGAPDSTVMDVAGAKKKRRYSIGANPRVRTLANVSRHCKRLLKRHEKVIREFLPKPRQLPAKALSGTYLSTAEKQALRG